MSKIHQSGVLHYDAFMRNSLVVPAERRAVWIDFSCAHLNEETYLGEEMEGAASSILYRVFALVASSVDKYSSLRMQGVKVLGRQFPPMPLIHLSPEEFGPCRIHLHSH
jgi:tRNA A-37 threonylcarbamoyl transferase component Bud32